MIDVWFAVLLAGAAAWQALGVLAYMALRNVTKRGGRHE